MVPILLEYTDISTLKIFLTFTKLSFSIFSDVIFKFLFLTYEILGVV